MSLITVSPRRRWGAAALVIGSLAGSLLLAGPVSAAPTTGLLNGQFGIDQVFPVQRVPAYPPCTSDSDLSPWTVTVNPGELSASYPYSEPTGSPVDIGDDYLAIVPSGDIGHPWAIARFTPDGDEVRYDGSAWITEPLGGWTTEERFAGAGQLYGLADEGFLHASFPSDYGNFFSTAGVLVAGQSVTSTPLVGFNICSGGRAVADVDALGSYPVPGAPISRTSLEALVPSTGTLSPAFVSGTTSYNLAVPAGSTPTFTVTPVEQGASITASVGGTPVTVTGTTVGPVPLAGGSTTLTITVTASNGETRTYTIVITTPALADTGTDATIVVVGSVAAVITLAAGVALMVGARRRSNHRESAIGS